MKDYGIPIIGTMDDLSKIKIDDLKKWYANYYVPNNATLILAGNFESNNAKSLIKKYYGNYSKQKVIDYSKANMHEMSFNEITAKDKVSQPMILLSFKNKSFSIEDKKEL